MIIAADTGRVEQVIGADEVPLSAPAWHVDGQRLSFAVSGDFLRVSSSGGITIISRDAVNRIDLFDLRTRTRSRLLSLPPSEGFMRDLAVAPDGTRLVFVAGGQIRLFDGSLIKTLTMGDTPVWHPDGKSILFVRGYDCRPTFGCSGDEFIQLSI